MIIIIEMDNNSQNILFRDQHDTEYTGLLSHASLAENDKFDPEEIATDPAAAENFNIEKRFLSVAFDKINSPSAVNCTGVQSSEDSFDWLEDDKDLYEITKGLYTGPPVTLRSKSSLYDNAQPDNPQAIRLDDDSDEGEENYQDEDENWLIQRKVYYGAMLIIQIILLGISALTLSGFDFGTFVGLPLHYWTLLGSLIVFIPFLSSWSLKLLVKGLRHSWTFGNGELPNFLDTLRMPLVMLMSTLFVFHFWFKYFPKDCLPSDNPVSFCFYEIADKIYYGFIITSLAFAAEIIVMFFATLKFHERTFKTRIINCRFKIYVVQQLALKALSAEHQRTAILEGNGSRILSSVSQDSLNLHEQRDDNSYIQELINSVKRIFSTSTTSTIISGGQQAIGTAANFVQIHVEDNAATVPVAHSSSQSYEKFSKKLKKHMKLYGYSQFSLNKTGLKDTEARLLSRDLFHFLCTRGKHNLTFEDLSTCFASSQAARDAFDIFDQDQDGTISKKEFRNTIVSIYADLRDLTKSIKTAGQALQKLDTILKIVFVLGLSLLVLTLFSINVTNMLTLTLSVVIGLNFMIGDLTKHFLSSLILLFVNHPFDIGDTIVVGLFEEGCYLKDILTVKQMNLMNTVFTRWNGQETYVPNHMLANAPFMTNLSRTVEQWEMIEFKVPSIVPESVLSDLRKNIGAFLQTHDKFYYKIFDMHAIVAADMAESEKNIDELEFNLRVKCKPTSDAQKRWVRHAKLLKFIKVTLTSIHEVISKESINQ